MKRSHAIALGATGIIFAGLWMGRGVQKVGNETPKDAAIYASTEECIRAGVLGSDVCEAEFRKAADSHLAAAPKFPSQSACETQYGASQCRSTTVNGASVFVPAMVGFMVANYLSNQRQAQPLLPPNAMGAAPCPPGVTPAMQPGCLMPRQASSSGSSSSSGWRSYSTSSGSNVSRPESGNGVAKVPGNVTSAGFARSSSGSLSSSSSSSSIRSSSSTTSRGGFGSTGRSTFSSSSS
jgi:uncharacterized protein YgiB involved in biofilm formation